jgi:hypothetical protein
MSKQTPSQSQNQNQALDPSRRQVLMGSAGIAAFASFPMVASGAGPSTATTSTPQGALHRKHEKTP